MTEYSNNLYPIKRWVKVVYHSDHRDGEVLQVIEYPNLKNYYIIFNPREKQISEVILKKRCCIIKYFVFEDE